jgi:hypothetical protein
MKNTLTCANLNLTDAVLSRAKGLTHLFGEPYARYERILIKRINK